MNGWSRLLMWCFSSLCRQSCLLDHDRTGDGFEVCQHLYRDSRLRLHWDRYVHVRGGLKRLFTARIRTVEDRLHETFVIYGIPIRLAFAIEVDGDALCLRLCPSESSPAAWLTRVTYRTGAGDVPNTLRTHGDFRIPLLGLRVLMRFDMIGLREGND